MMSFIKRMKIVRIVGSYCYHNLLYFRLLFFRNENSYCWWLWSTVFINSDGTVYPCCHKQPGVIGNIYQENLKNIWNGKRMRKYRELCLKGRLRCMVKCNILPVNLVRKDIDNIKIIVPYEGLKRLWLLFGERCNLSCKMCSQDHSSKTVLSDEVILKNIDFGEINEIVLQGGEPMFMKEVLNTYLYLGEKCNKKVNFITNGTIMNKKWAENISKYSDNISFSINAATKNTHELVNKGSQWNRVLKNIMMVSNAKKKLNANLVIYGHMTIVIENIVEIPLFIENALRIGFDAINFGYDNPSVPKWLRNRPAQKEELKRQIKVSIKNSNMKIDTNSLKHLDLV